MSTTQFYSDIGIRVFLAITLTVLIFFTYLHLKDRDKE